MGPKHTPESVARELIAGLERGTIVLGRSGGPPSDPEWEAVAGRIGRELAGFVVHFEGQGITTETLNLLLARVGEVAARAVEERKAHPPPSPGKL
jgi:hypothetical protein